MFGLSRAHQSLLPRCQPHHQLPQLHQQHQQGEIVFMYTKKSFVLFHKTLVNCKLMDILPWSYVLWKRSCNFWISVTSPDFHESLSVRHLSCLIPGQVLNATITEYSDHCEEYLFLFFDHSNHDHNWHFCSCQCSLSIMRGSKSFGNWSLQKSLPKFWSHRILPNHLFEWWWCL